AAGKCLTMEALERGARMIVWLIAGALILWSVMDLSLYVVVQLHDEKPIEVLPCVTNSIPLFIGIVLLIKTKSIAQWICDKLE
ncbi:MAG TPA: hypothetical protein VN516_04670, partial [Candidatus Baltobacteraceae bacterium]|nr:hypothetical protein [Candidatus Baltobacteraceae bacterium]